MALSGDLNGVLNHLHTSSHKLGVFWLVFKFAEDLAVVKQNVVIPRTLKKSLTTEASSVLSLATNHRGDSSRNGLRKRFFVSQ